MIRFLTLRLLLTAASLWLILTMVFFLIHLVPGDPVEQMLGEGARAEDLAELRGALGLDKPVAAQYADYLGGVARADFGQSFRFQRPVLSVVLERYPATLQLALATLLVSMLIGIPAGAWAAHRRGRAADRSKIGRAHV